MKRFDLRSGRHVAMLGCGLALAAGLAACGGGSDGGSTAQGGSTPTQSASVPDSAFASTSSFVAYLAALPQTDTAEPLNVNGTPPVTDTDDATPVSI